MDEPIPEVGDIFVSTDPFIHKRELRIDDIGVGKHWRFPDRELYKCTVVGAREQRIEWIDEKALRKHYKKVDRKHG